MADIALEQLLHTAGDNTLSTTDGALHGYMRGTDGTTTRTVKTDANGNIIISPDSGLGTETTLAALATLLTSLNGKVATDAKLEAARLLLASLNGKDFATQTTLAAVLAKLADPATATKQDAAKGVLDAISTAVAARATEATLAAIKDALTDGTQKVQLTGTLTELFGASLSDRPPASSVSVGATFMVVGTDIVYQSNGTDWVVIS
jgi:hypothetical protein